MRVVAQIARSGVAAWRRRPLLLAGLSVMLLGPLVCWSLYFGRVLPRLGLLPTELHPWLMIAGAVAIWIGWVLLGAHLRPLGSGLGGALLGGVLYMVAGWVFFLGLTIYVGNSPLVMLARPPSLQDVRILMVWTILAAGMLGLIPLN
jgi:hypothetical protein